MGYRTKLSILLEHMAANRWDKALALAATFHDLGEHRAAIVRAHEVIAHPRFYETLGTNLGEARAAGIAALKARYQESKNETTKGA